MRTTDPEIEACVGVLIRDGRVLMQWRPPGGSLDGCWEFPGGKRRPGESAAVAMRRELAEETGIRVDSARPLIEIPHRYPGLRVRLSVWAVSEWYPAEPAPRGGRRFRWIDIGRLPRVRMPAANRGIVQALRLPPLYLVSGAWPGNDNTYITRLLELVPARARLVYLRPGQTDPAAYRRLAARAAAALAGSGATLMVRDNARLARSLGSGLHASGRYLRRLSRRPLPRHLWFAVSCHGAADLRRAARLEADFVTLSPVAPTASHPRRRALGWAQFARLAAQAPMPVYALGGMEPSLAEYARAAGGQGVAVLSALWDRA